MDPLAILALVDASLSTYEHAMQLLAQARQQGLITAEQQAERLARVQDIRARVGLPTPG